MNASSVACGFYGKVPTHGDFVRRRVPDDFLAPWDEWLQRSIAEARDGLGANWLEVYLTSPVWRFLLARGVCGPTMALGVLLPSVDRVGRYFPMTVLATGLPDSPLPNAAEAAATWFDELERIAVTVVAEDDFRLDDFDARVERMAGHDAVAHLIRGLSRTTARHCRGRSLAMLASLEEAGRVATAWRDLVAAQLETLASGACLWWTAGSERVGSCLLMTDGLPDAVAFRAMLDGGWQGAD